MKGARLAAWGPSGGIRPQPRLHLASQSLPQRPVAPEFLSHRNPFSLGSDVRPYLDHARASAQESQIRRGACPEPVQPFL